MNDQLKEPENRFLGRIADLDDSDKPREKALALGIRSLSNAELLAIIFGSGLPGKSVISMSQEVLASCDNRLSRLSRLSIHEMKKRFKGVGTAKAISLAAAFELGLRTRDEEAALDPQIKCSTDIYNIIVFVLHYIYTGSQRKLHRLGTQNRQFFIFSHGIALLLIAYS